MRARLALRVSGVVYEHREVALKAKPAAMLAASPKGTVPVLCLPSGKVLDESWDIMRWALLQHDPQSWMPDSPETQRRLHAGVALNDGEFKTHLDRYKYPQRFGLENGLHHRALGAQILMHWESTLQAQLYLAGPRWGLLDACVAPFVRQFARTDRAWFEAQAWPQLCQWLRAFENSSAFEKVMGKHPVWSPPEA